MRDLLAVSLPLIVGPLTYLAVQGIKRASGWMDAQPALMKRTLAVVIAFSLTVLAEQLGVPAPCSVADPDCFGRLTPHVIEGFVAALVAMAVHSVVKPAAPAEPVA